MQIQHAPVGIFEASEQHSYLIGEKQSFSLIFWVNRWICAIVDFPLIYLPVPSALELELTMAKLPIICQHPRKFRISSDPSMLRE